MKLPNPSVQIRYRIFPCLTNISSSLKGTFWLTLRQQSSTIGSMNIKIHTEVDVFDYMPINTIIHDRIQWKPCNYKSHYTQLCKVSHGYTEKVHTTKITSSGIHTWPKLHINKDLLNKLWSPKNITLQQIMTYLKKSFFYTGILFINSTLCHLFQGLAIASTYNLGVGPARELVSTSQFR